MAIVLARCQALLDPVCIVDSVCISWPCMATMSLGTAFCFEQFEGEQSQKQLGRRAETDSS